ncbi:hypothetical protein BC567DRAFT_210870 [Phyllosticta citribraziliensis]
MHWPTLLRLPYVLTTGAAFVLRLLVIHLHPPTLGPRQSVKLCVHRPELFLGAPPVSTRLRRASIFVHIEALYSSLLDLVTRSKARAGAQGDSSGPGSADAVVSTQGSRLPTEDYRRPILVVKKDGNGNEDLKLFFALFDTGSSDVNLISAKLVKYLELEMRDRSRWSRILDVLFPWRKKSQLCNTDGTSIHQEGKVKIRWYCRDQTVYDKQALWFTPGFYVTEHFVVENATADVLLSLSTWDELGLRDRPISMITRKPQPDMSKGNLQKVAADKAMQTETRIGKKSKIAAATMEAYRAKKAAKYSSSSSNGNGA